MQDAAIRELNSARRLSFSEQLARRARKVPEERALRFEGQDRSVGELDERVTRLANALAERGIEQGDRVATLAYNAMEVIETYLAASRLGAIAVPINFRLVADEITYIAENSGAKALFVDAQLASVAGAVRERVPALKACLVASDDPSAAGPGAESYEAVLAASSTVPPGIDVNEFDPAFIMYTSGTTGRPKGAVLSHWNLLMNTFNLISLCGLQSGETFLSGLPLFHIGGLNLICPQLLLGGTTVILATGDFSAEKVVDLLEAEQATGCYFVPTQWQQICAVPGLAERDLNLKRIMWGASVAPPSVLKAMEEHFPVPTFNFFGQTEMSSITCTLLGDDAVRKQGSIGKPIANVEARLVDPEMRDVPQGEVGEIVYRGPTVMQGYWQNEEATADAFRGGWFHSGDLVREDEEGFMYVVDRAKDMIISGGENIYCAEVEAVIDAHPKVLEVAIIGEPHEKWVETPVAIVAASDGEDPPSEDEIIGWCKERMASYKKPSRVVLVDALPRNASGKVLKFKLREEHAGRPTVAG